MAISSMALIVKTTSSLMPITLLSAGFTIISMKNAILVWRISMMVSVALLIIISMELIVFKMQSIDVLFKKMMIIVESAKIILIVTNVV